MTVEIAIVGVGGQGRECLDIVRAMTEAGHDIDIRGFYDDAPAAANHELVEAAGFKVLGGFSDLLEDARAVQVVLGVGSGRVRQQLDEALASAGFSSPVLVHPHATIGEGVELGEGSVVFAGARFTTNIRVGRHVHVNQNATIGHDVILADYATVNPQAAVSGGVTVGEAATVGAGAVVLQYLQVADGATVGASACVVRDVAAGMTVVGVPAGMVAKGVPAQ